MDPRNHYALSDQNSKTEIQRLSSQNDALSTALADSPSATFSPTGDKREFNNANEAIAADTGKFNDEAAYQKLKRHAQQLAKDESERSYDKFIGAYQGGNLPPTEYPRLPSHTQFAPLPPSPQAQQVAAQNQQLMAPPAQPLVPVPPVPQGNAFPRPAPARPDLSALDEAYRRMGGVPNT